MNIVWNCMFTPRLYKIHNDGHREEMYQQKGLEKWSDKIIASANTLLNFGLYTSPFLCFYLFRRGFLSSDAKFLVQCLGGLGCLFALCFVLRGVGRAFNPQYMAFVNALYQPQTDRQAFLDGIRRYDFEAQYWPVTYQVTPHAVNESWVDNPFSRCANPELPVFKRTLIQLLAYLATRLFGLRLVYPGSVELFNHILWGTLLQGRIHLVEEYQGKRARIGTADMNIIDTMFVDHRPSVKGKILVICCEGNSGYYEIGLMTTPVKAGYSVLGWNHPGFSGSTGNPYPEQEKNAIDAVVQYAINELDFQPEDIVMYGWSIGGYTATWACVQYPVKGLILDATFDDILPLALNQMPASWSLLVQEVIRSYINLNIAEMIENYAGPVQLIRRTEDEIISIRSGKLSTNRGNNLLLRLVESRHPNLSNTTREQLRRLVAYNEPQRAVVNYTTSAQQEQRTVTLRTLIEHPMFSPATRKHLQKMYEQKGSHRCLIYLASLSVLKAQAVRLIESYMRDFNSSHCTPLSDHHFGVVMDAILNMKRS